MLGGGPAKVVLALKMLYVGIGIGVIRTALVVLRHLEVRTPDFLIMVKVVIWAGVLYSIFQAGKGRNWARWVLVALLIITIPLNLLPLIPAFADYPFDGSLGVLQYALFFTGVGLLFHPDATAWFGKGSGSVPPHALP
jgi:hypothetical protein